MTLLYYHGATAAKAMNLDGLRLLYSRPENNIHRPLKWLLGARRSTDLLNTYIIQPTQLSTVFSLVYNQQ